MNQEVAEAAHAFEIDQLGSQSTVSGGKGGGGRRTNESAAAAESAVVVRSDLTDRTRWRAGGQHVREPCWERFSQRFSQMHRAGEERGERGNFKPLP